MISKILYDITRSSVWTASASGTIARGLGGLGEESCGTCLRRALLQPSLVFGRSGQPVSMLFPPCSQVYLGCRDGVPMIPGGSSSSGREPRSDALRPRQSCRMGTRSEADRSRSARLLDASDIADFAFCPPQKVRRFPWLWGRRESIAGPIEHGIALT